MYELVLELPLATYTYFTLVAIWLPYRGTCADTLVVHETICMHTILRVEYIFYVLSYYDGGGHDHADQRSDVTASGHIFPQLN